MNDAKLRRKTDVSHLYLYIDNKNINQVKLF